LEIIEDRSKKHWSWQKGGKDESGKKTKVGHHNATGADCGFKGGKESSEEGL